MATATVKQQNKKQQKDLKRRKRQKEQGIRRAQIQRRREFPQFELGPTGFSEPEFVDAVYAAARKVDFYSHSDFEAIDRLAWKNFARLGEWTIELFRQAANRCSLPDVQHQIGDLMTTRLLGTICQAVYSLVPGEIKERFMPLNYFMVVPHRRKLELHFDRLITKHTPGGSVHFSRSPVILDDGGERKILAFTTHAMHRACERIAPSWKRNFADLMEVLRFFEGIPSYETVTLHPDQEGILLYASCGPSYADQYVIFVDQVLGQEKVDPDGQPPEYRLGYCPLAFHGPYAVAKTLLPPGYKSTPEYRQLLRCVPPRGIKAELMAIARSHVPDLDRSEEWLPLIKWFHDNGVPQVRQRAS